MLSESLSTDAVMTLHVRVPLTRPLVDEITDLCRGVEGPDGAAVAVLRIEGRLDDADDEVWSKDVDVDLVTRWERALRRFERLDAVTVAVAGGVCTGAGLDALLCADVRIGCPDLVLRPAWTAARGPWPGMALYRLVRDVGVARMRHAVLFGSAIDARRALELGLLDEVNDDPGGVVRDIARRAAALDAAHLAMRRQLLFDSASVGFDESLGAHLAACDRMLRASAGGAS